MQIFNEMTTIVTTCFLLYFVLLCIINRIIQNNRIFIYINYVSLLRQINCINNKSLFHINEISDEFQHAIQTIFIKTLCTYIQSLSLLRIIFAYTMKMYVELIVTFIICILPSQ